MVDLSFGIDLKGTQSYSASTLPVLAQNFDKITDHAVQLHVSSTIFSKGNICDFLFTFLDDIALSQWCPILKKRVCFPYNY